MQSPRGSLQEWIRVSLRAGMDETCSVLSFAQCFREPLGLALRRREAKRCIKATAKSCARVRWISESQAMFLPKVKDFDLIHLLDTISGRLVRIARRPLTAKELLIAVPISNKERLKWTKDGSLVQQGTASFRRGQAISMTTYAIDPVEALLANPSEIERWRARDSWLETR